MLLPGPLSPPPLCLLQVLTSDGQLEPAMPFARQVSIGRVALVQYPEAEAGKLVVISDVVSPNAVSAAEGHGLPWGGLPLMQQALGAAGRPGRGSSARHRVEGRKCGRRAAMETPIGGCGTAGGGGGGGGEQQRSFNLHEAATCGATWLDARRQQ